MFTRKLASMSLAAAVAAVAALIPAFAPAAPRKAPPKKPASRKAAPGGPIVLGTTQLPGDFGKFGTTYTIGGRNPLNFTLVSAEYRSDRFVLGSSLWGNKADEKVLVLNYILHNPNPREEGIRWSSVRFTAVDNQDTNHAYIQNTVRTGTSKDSLNMSLKPAQKVEVTTAIVVPADGVVPKLIVERGGGNPVIRYDLRGKVKPIPAPFADPADPSGATPLKNAPVPAGQYIPTGAFDIKLDSVAYTTEKMNNRPPRAGQRYLVATFTLRNATQSRRSYAWGTFRPFVTDADGEKVAYNQVALKAGRDENASGNLEPGEEARVRYFFQMPENVNAKTFSIAEGAGRTMVFDVSNAS